MRKVFRWPPDCLLPPKIQAPSSLRGSRLSFTVAGIFATFSIHFMRLRSNVGKWHAPLASRVHFGTTAVCTNVAKRSHFTHTVSSRPITSKAHSNHYITDKRNKKSVSSTITSMSANRILIRGKEGTDLISNIHESTESQFKIPGPNKFYERSNDGSTLALQTPDGMRLVNLAGDTNATIELEDSIGVQNAHFSPLNSYLLSWERGAGLKIWCAKTGKCLKQLNLKMIKKKSWPNVQWTADEKYMFHLVTNEVQVYDIAGSNTEVYAEQPQFKFHSEGISSYQLAPALFNNEEVYHFTSFTEGKKGKPAKIFAHSFDPKIPTVRQFQCVASKSFFNAEECTTQWSPSAHAALILTQTSVDTSGDSYYGSTGLYLLSMDPEASESTSTVPLAKEGVVSDVAWCPDASKPPCFVVISGKMPALGCLHHGVSCDPVFLFGEAHRNTVSWSPHGRFLCLAGFGNLAGGMDFWDRNKLKKMNAEGTITASRVVVGYDWSPDSRHFLVSTTAPRMNVENGLAVYKYNGDGPVKTMDIGTLYQANWVPSVLTEYPDRPATPVKKKKKKAQDAEEKQETAAPKVVGRYVPPSARGRSGGMSLADRMRAEKDAKSASSGAPRKVTKTEGLKLMGAAAGVPVGMSADASAYEKEKKAKKAAEKKEKARVKKLEEERAAKEAAEAEALAKKQAQEALELANKRDPVKRAKKINKILKQIEEIKKKPTETLNDDQKQKLVTEDALRVELASFKI